MKAGDYACEARSAGMAGASEGDGGYINQRRGKELVV